MPAIKVYAKKMEPTMQEAVAKQFLTMIQEYLNVPLAEVIFLCIDKVYGNDEMEHCLLEIEGPGKSAEIVERLGQSLCAIFADVSGWDCHVSAIYHPNSPDNVIDRKGSLLKFLKEK
ncbi:hypothetical protein FACS1894190_04370 [Spirochaetia bacterium]|nr:hypothetical protein FACS1894190_04370 [Spirochaetia bacterium]